MHDIELNLVSFGVPPSLKLRRTGLGKQASQSKHKSWLVARGS